MKQKYLKIFLGTVLTSLLIIFTSCQQFPNSKTITIRSANSTWIQELFPTYKKDTSLDGKNFGFPILQQGIVANKKFLEANPVARKWFELVQIPIEDMNAESLRIKEGEDEEEDILRHAQEWVENNQEKYSSWLETARQAAN